MSQEDEGSSSLVVDNIDQNQNFRFDRLIFDGYWNHVEVGSRTLQFSWTNTTKVKEPIDVSKSVEILRDYVDKRYGKDNFSTIYEVPSRLRDVNPSAFTPRVVSIGPMHKGRANLKLMEDKKPTYLYDLFGELERERGISKQDTLKECIQKVSDSIEEIRKLYYGQFYDRRGYTDNKLAQMMVMDGCFILQFINKLSKSGDVLHINRLHSRSIAMDLVLLENQIPYSVLQLIYDLTLKTLETYRETELTTFLYELLQRVNPFFEKLNIDNLSIKRFPSHILDVLHEFYNPQFFEVPQIEAIPMSDSAVELHEVLPPQIEAIPMSHSAVELHEVGVRFRLNKENSWLMDISFKPSSRKPIFRMSKVLIDNYFEVVMRNLIAYEQYSSPIGNYVTSYAMAIYMLVATPADIVELAESSVIVNHLGSNKNASNMISSICKHVTFPDFYYIKSWEAANKHYDSYWSKSFADFRQEYCSSPWRIIALLAAIIFFLITIVEFGFKAKKFALLH